MSKIKDLKKVKYSYFKRLQMIQKYIGEIDPSTKLRNGKGIYFYDNPYFKYEGDYLQGKKHGQEIR